ncbi:PEP-CTERM sorting domain-containing protein [Chitinophaga niabensis]
MREPITPEPSTAILLILLCMFSSF